MHIPDNYLSPSTCAVLAAAMIPVWIHAADKVKKELPKEKIAVIGAGAAFSFVSMMFNIPLPGGTTGHAVGAALIAILLGPEAACLAVSSALLVQALLFGDGGILSFGANCVNMAFFMPYTGFFVYKLFLKILSKGKEPKFSHRIISAGIGSYAGINAAAFLAAVEFGIQPYLFHNEAGQALYCPYGLNVSIPSMMIGHLTIFGLAEVIFTTGVLAFIIKMVPSLSGKETEVKTEKKEFIPAVILLAVLIILVPLGLLAEGTAWGEWSAEEIAGIQTNGTELGYIPSGLKNGWVLKSLFPDYSVNGVPEVLGYILSAVIGTAILVIIFRVISSFKKTKK